MKRYTLVIEPAAHPEARRELVVEARGDGDACDQATDHAAAELPYRCTIAIAKIEEIAARPIGSAGISGAGGEQRGSLELSVLSAPIAARDALDPGPAAESLH